MLRFVICSTALCQIFAEVPVNQAAFEVDDECRYGNCAVNMLQHGGHMKRTTCGGSIAAVDGWCCANSAWTYIAPQMDGTSCTCPGSYCVRASSSEYPPWSGSGEYWPSHPSGADGSGGQSSSSGGSNSSKSGGTCLSEISGLPFEKIRSLYPACAQQVENLASALLPTTQPDAQCLTDLTNNMEIKDFGTYPKCHQAIIAYVKTPATCLSQLKNQPVGWLAQFPNCARQLEGDYTPETQTDVGCLVDLNDKMEIEELKRFPKCFEAVQKDFS